MNSIPSQSSSAWCTQRLSLKGWGPRARASSSWVSLSHRKEISNAERKASSRDSLCDLNRVFRGLFLGRTSLSEVLQMICLVYKLYDSGWIIKLTVGTSTGLKWMLLSWLRYCNPRPAIWELSKLSIEVIFSALLDVLGPYLFSIKLQKHWKVPK